MRRPPVPEFCIDQLEALYHLSAEAAAERLGVGATKFKAECRKLGLERWPFRKVTQLQQLAKRIVVGRGSEQDVFDARRLVRQLRCGATSPIWENLGLDYERFMQQVSNHELSVDANKHLVDASSIPRVTSLGHSDMDSGLPKSLPSISNAPTDALLPSALTFGSLPSSQSAGLTNFKAFLHQAVPKESSPSTSHGVHGLHAGLSPIQHQGGWTLGPVYQDETKAEIRAGAEFDGKQNVEQWPKCRSQASIEFEKLAALEDHLASSRRAFQLCYQTLAKRSENNAVQLPSIPVEQGGLFRTSSALHSGWRHAPQCGVDTDRDNQRTVMHRGWSDPITGSSSLTADELLRTLSQLSKASLHDSISGTSHLLGTLSQSLDWQGSNASLLGSGLFDGAGLLSASSSGNGPRHGLTADLSSDVLAAAFHVVQGAQEAALAARQKESNMAGNSSNQYFPQNTAAANFSLPPTSDPQRCQPVSSIPDMVVRFPLPDAQVAPALLRGNQTPPPVVNPFSGQSVRRQGPGFAQDWHAGSSTGPVRGVAMSGISTAAALGLEGKPWAELGVDTHANAGSGLDFGRALPRSLAGINQLRNSLLPAELSTNGAAGNAAPGWASQLLEKYLSVITCEPTASLLQKSSNFP